MTKTKGAGKSVSAKGRPWTFPRNTLEDAIRIAKAVEEKNAGNPMPAKDLAVAVGFRQPQDWRFLELLRSANQYGLVTGTPSSSIDLTKFGRDIVAPSSPNQRSEGLLAAFRSVKEFADTERFYGGKRIPEDEFFLNTLTREFGVPRDRVDVFSKIFLENLKYLRAFSPTPSPADSSLSPELAGAPTPPEQIPSPVSPKEPR